jgi:DNA polymerase III delta subunit
MVTGRARDRATFEEAEALLRAPAEKLPPIVLAAGSDEFLRGRAVAAFRAGAIAEGAEFQRVEGDELTAEALANALASISLFAGARRLWIREGAKLGKACEEALLAWADGPGEGVRVLVTTGRAADELKLFQALSARGITIACEVARAEEARWVHRMVEEAGLRLPAGAAAALAESAGTLLAACQEVEKLRALADASGTVPAGGMAALRGARADGSLHAWADALLAGDAAGVRREAAGLDAGRVSGTSALWAVAERALAALEPQAFRYPRYGGGPPAGVRPSARVARASLDAVYAADRALKRGEIRDAEIRDVIEQRMRGIVGA